MQFHILSFEGPDDYARVGGLATRVEGLAGSLAAAGAETHLWFVGDPDAPSGLRRSPAHERRLRAAGRATATTYRWREILDRVLLLRIELLRPPPDRDPERTA